MTRPLAALLLAAALPTALALAGCDRRADSGPVVVSAIGGAPRLADPSRAFPDAPGRAMLDSTAQGLVRFDGNGQIEAGLAERWIVIDDGMSYIFRLRAAAWSDGTPVTAAQVVAALRRTIARRSTNPVAPYLTAVKEIVEMTPEVIEVRLDRPRPDLLNIFAQPEMAIVNGSALAGSGPFRIVSTGARSVLLRPAVDLDRSPDEVKSPAPEEHVRLIGERAASAVARFAAKDSDLVTGGSFADWPVAAAAQIAPANIRIDPATGLFGLAIARREGLLADVAGRNAVAAAIDRAAIVAAFVPGWAAVGATLPEQIDSASPPMQPDWALLTLDQRREGARATVAAWRAAHEGAPVRLRIALPPGPGSTILFAYLAASLRTIGVDAARVGLADDADLRLVDAVAPYDSARWYLATACAPCGDVPMAALENARLAPTLADRALRIAESDRAIAADVPFIAIAQPLRWSLVALRLRQWQGNSRAWHPLNRLRNEGK